VGLLQGRRVDQVDQEAGERVLEVAVVAAFLGEGCRDLVVVGGLRMRQQAQVHNLRLVEKQLAHRLDLTEVELGEILQTFVEVIYDLEVDLEWVLVSVEHFLA